MIRCETKGGRLARARQGAARNAPLLHGWRDMRLTPRHSVTRAVTCATVTHYLRDTNVRHIFYWNTVFVGVLYYMPTFSYALISYQMYINQLIQSIDVIAESKVLKCDKEPGLPISASSANVGYKLSFLIEYLIILNDVNVSQWMTLIHKHKTGFFVVSWGKSIKFSNWMGLLKRILAMELTWQCHQIIMAPLDC